MPRLLENLSALNRPAAIDGIPRVAEISGATMNTLRDPVTGKVLPGGRDDGAFYSWDAKAEWLGYWRGVGVTWAK